MRYGTAVATALLAGVAVWTSGSAGAANLEDPGATRINSQPSRFVPIPDTIPHAEGAYIDRRLVRQLRWISAHFEIYITEGFAGKLPNGETVGCADCHVHYSEHKIGLAVDIIPLDNDPNLRCGRDWRDVARLARWAEPQQGSPLPPFRWVGYDGDYNHGCGNHLHLSWSHARDYDFYKPSAWVEVFRTPPLKTPY